MADEGPTYHAVPMATIDEAMAVLLSILRAIDNLTEAVNRVAVAVETSNKPHCH